MGLWKARPRVMAPVYTGRGMPASPDPRQNSGTALGDEVYSVLGEAILEGRLAPGERLRDHELAQRLGVSRTPVREALQRLEVIGLVEVSPNRYTRVSTPSAASQRYTQEFVTLLMGNAALLALPRCDDGTLESLVAQADDLVEASHSGDPARILAASAHFFPALTHATGNPAFIRVLREAEFALRRNLVGWRPPIADEPTRTALYREFRDAIAARDGAAAELVLRRLHLLA